MLQFLIGTVSEKSLLVFGMMVCFFGTVLLLRVGSGLLPTDAGRAFAHDGSLTAGRPRGAGLLFILLFAVAAFLFVPVNTELVVYLIMVIAAMLTGFLDDASATSWGEYKKGALDLIVAVLTAVTFINFNGTTLHFALLGTSVTLHPLVYGALAVILIWVSINVTNCSDGVDGLSSSVSIVSLLSFFVVNLALNQAGSFNSVILLFVMALLAYLWFNAHPNQMMMGDAGSRAMGLFLAICALKTGSPVLFVPLALVLILDGGLGLIKVSLLRFLKIKILVNVRTPLHDHVRKNRGWSDTQCVFRFVIIQSVLSVVTIMLIK